MSNKRIRPIKTIVIFTARSIASCTKIVILDIVMFYCDRVGPALDLNFEASFAEHDGFFFQFSVNDGF